MIGGDGCISYKGGKGVYYGTWYPPRGGGKKQIKGYMAVSKKKGRTDHSPITHHPCLVASLFPRAFFWVATPPVISRIPNKSLIHRVMG